MNQELVHATVLLNEAVEALQIKTDGIYVDGTFGRVIRLLPLHLTTCKLRLVPYLSLLLAVRLDRTL